MMDGYSYGVPIIALPDQLGLPTKPRLSPSAHRAATQTLTALDRLHHAARNVGGAESFIDWQGIAPLVACAADHAKTLAETLAVAAPPIPAEAIADPNPIRSYFGVRGATLSAAQLAAQESAVIARGLMDLQSAPIGTHDLAAEVTGAALVLRDFVSHPAQVSRAKPPLTGEPALLFAGYRPSGAELQRWIVAHQVYFMFNVRAAATVHLALKALDQGRDAHAAEYLTVAGHYVRGFTGAMGHAGAINRTKYREQIRPTMAPPQAPVPLTGRMHKEHRAFRTALKQLLDALPEPHPTLSARSPNLAHAREELLEADLLDIERHILIAAALIGAERSLIQRGHDDNAVSTLHQMRLLRAAQYCPLLRFGDQAAAKSVAVAREQLAKVDQLSVGAGRV